MSHVVDATWGSCSWDADWCLQFDGMPNPRLQDAEAGGADAPAALLKPPISRGQSSRATGLKNKKFSVFDLANKFGPRVGGSRESRAKVRQLRCWVCTETRVLKCPTLCQLPHTHAALVPMLVGCGLGMWGWVRVGVHACDPRVCPIHVFRQAWLCLCCAVTTVL